jgi:hypothetical protein
MMNSKAVLLLLLAAMTARAAEPTSVEARIKFISMTRPLTGVGVAHGKTATGIVIPTDMFSDEIVYRGPARLELIETLTKEVPSKEKPVVAEEKTDEDRPARGVKGRPRNLEHTPAGKPPLAWVDLPTNAGRLNLILLVTPGKGNGISVLNDPPGAFPPGSNRDFNLAPFPVTVKTPSGAYPIAPNAEKILRPGAPNNDYYDLQLATKVDGDDVLAFSSRVFHMEKVRKLYLILPVPGAAGRITLRDIEDRPAPTKAQGPTPVGPKGAK